MLLLLFIPLSVYMRRARICARCAFRARCAPDAITRYALSPRSRASNIWQQRRAPPVQQRNKQHRAWRRAAAARLFNNFASNAHSRCGLWRKIMAAAWRGHGNMAWRKNVKNEMKNLNNEKRKNGIIISASKIWRNGERQ